MLRDVSVEIPSGANAAILGPSGSGKTTLLSLIGGLLKPQSGSIVWSGDDGRYPASAVVTWVLQTVSLLPHRTLVDNVAIGAFLDGASRSEAVRRSVRALEDVGLGDRRDDRAKTMSGGELQRVAIARALASGRPVMLADEPTGQLDASTSAKVLDALFSVGGRTMILVTHDEAAAARCDVVFRIVDGELQCNGVGHVAAEI